MAATAFMAARLRAAVGVRRTHTAAVPNYADLAQTLAHARMRRRASVATETPLTLAHKLLLAHEHPAAPPSTAFDRGQSNLKLRPDRVAMQDASAQTALLQFMIARLPQSAVPTSIHCDHLIQARDGAAADVRRAEHTSGEIFAFLNSAARRFGIDFWRPGSGIIHQIVLENYAFPGGLMLGTDSHTPNAGGLGMLAIGVGGADAVDAMTNTPWELRLPKVIGVRLSGSFSGWSSAKDLILRLAGELTVQGATNHIIEYFGPGVDSISCTGMATICNMGAELGATTSVFPFTNAMHEFLVATGRSNVASAAASAAKTGLLSADADAQYDRIIDIDLSKVSPRVNGPFTPDLSHALSDLVSVAAAKGWPAQISAALIGSCTNSSYEDMTRAAAVARQAIDAGLVAKIPFYVTPGSEQIRATMERDGLIDAFKRAGGTILANACGPCIGQWDRDGAEKDEPNAIVTSYNRNFAGRNDGSTKTMNFLASPEIVTAMAFSGKFGFNPDTDTIVKADGTSFKFASPHGLRLPPAGYETKTMHEFLEVSEPDSSVKVDIDPSSSRLQELKPFSAWNGKEISDARLLVKASGKCTTDHISAAGPWLKYKGHLENISRNTLIGATNAFTGQIGTTQNVLTGEVASIPDVAEAYRKARLPWIVVGDRNYGEGSAREHAAMQPRYLGCVAVVCRSFARIHETNLKKQGIVPLMFENPNDYEKISADDEFSTEGLVDALRGDASAKNSSRVVLVVKHSDGKTDRIPLIHTLSADQARWIRSGSAINAVSTTQ